MKYQKKYGQNFLYDQEVLNKIYSSINVQKEDLILEIGPGSGNLTKVLQNFNAQIVAIEIDETLKDKLMKIKNDKTEFIFKDILQVDLVELFHHYTYQKLYIIANIPYYITNPIITKIIESNLDITEVILMVQKEVADRLTSLPSHKTYGYLTLYVNSYYKALKLFNVSKSSFYPVPKVDSSIIKLTPVYYEVNHHKLNELLSSSFQLARCSCHSS